MPFFITPLLSAWIVKWDPPCRSGMQFKPFPVVLILLRFGVRMLRGRSQADFTNMFISGPTLKWPASAWPGPAAHLKHIASQPTHLVNRVGPSHAFYHLIGFSITGSGFLSLNQTNKPINKHLNYKILLVWDRPNIKTTCSGFLSLNPSRDKY